MNKIVFLPLDERPCNVKFPLALFDGGSMRVVSPACLGDKKIPADAAVLEEFLYAECSDAVGLVVSLDTLLYGGLIPSRLHHLPKEELLRRMDVLRSLHAQNPSMRIFAFQCIMRCPSYSSADEEPDYYGEWGAQIHALGIERHKAQQGQEQAEQAARDMENQIPAWAVQDYLGRRALNLELDLVGLSLVEEGVVEFLAVPQDDAAPLGFTAMDQAQVRLAVRQKRLQDRVLIYPGADELGMTLLAHMRNTLENRRPAVYVEYASAGAPFVVPPYEDRPLAETVRCQLAAAGCRLAVAPELADFILAVTAPSNNIAGASVQPRLDLDYDVCRSLSPFFAELCFWMDMGKTVTVCDNAYCNGGDLELLAMLDASGRLMQVAGYAGWNTSANTMGTAIALGVRYLYEGADTRLLDFLALRYLEDCGYDSVVRQQVTQLDLPALGLDYFHTDGAEGQAAACVARRLEEFIQKAMPSVAAHIRLQKVRLPWRRMFEAELEVRYTAP